MTAVNRWTLERQIESTQKELDHMPAWKLGSAWHQDRIATLKRLRAEWDATTLPPPPVDTSHPCL